MPASKPDAKLLMTATAAVVAAGVLVAVILLFATGRSSSPKKYEPFAAGNAKAIKQQLRDGGPYFFPDPFGGDKNVLLALEDGQVVALSSVLPGTKGCEIRWRGTLDRFTDCHGGRFTSRELDRFKTTVDPIGKGKGPLFIDLRTRVPAPG